MASARQAKSAVCCHTCCSLSAPARAIFPLADAAPLILDSDRSRCCWCPPEPPTAQLLGTRIRSPPRGSVLWPKAPPDAADTPTSEALRHSEGPRAARGLTFRTQPGLPWCPSHSRLPGDPVPQGRPSLASPRQALIVGLLPNPALASRVDQRHLSQLSPHPGLCAGLAPGVSPRASLCPPASHPSSPHLCSEALSPRQPCSSLPAAAAARVRPKPPGSGPRRCSLSALQGPNAVTDKGWPSVKRHRGNQ